VGVYSYHKSEHFKNFDHSYFASELVLQSTAHHHSRDFSFEHLSSDLWSYILNFLVPLEWIQCERVCKRWKEVLQACWKNEFLKTFQGDLLAQQQHGDSGMSTFFVLCYITTGKYICRPHVVFVMPVCCLYVAFMLPVCCLYVACMLPACCLCVALFHFTSDLGSKC
jgi:hypothetical protein